MRLCSGGEAERTAAGRLTVFFFADALTVAPRVPDVVARAVVRGAPMRAGRLEGSVPSTLLGFDLGALFGIGLRVYAWP